MKQVLVRQGEVVVEEVPAPQAEPGGVLVRVAASCISAGTEGAGISVQRQPLVRRALEHPERVKAALELVVEKGVARAVGMVRGDMQAPAPTGYSVAGRVVELGPGVTDLAVGDAVACAGAGLANHAEYVAVPRNLVARVPEGLALEDAATATLGAIALHGVRRALPTLGEWFAVVGLGLLGQLTAQLLRAHGCRVLGIDLDATRVELARSLGLAAALAPDEADPVAAVKRLTGGLGADGVIITAASASDALLSRAFRMCRRKGRVVVVGDVGLGMRREDVYPREIEFFISTSYGPGRYDPAYEQGGHDYPVAYVRWTENRNMQEYLRLLAEGQVRIGPLVRGNFPIERAAEAFAAAGAGTDGARAALPIVLLSYAGGDAAAPARRVDMTAHVRRGAAGDVVRVGLAGAGAFARGMHLPNLQKLSGRFALQAVMSRNGVTSLRVAEEFGASYATTDYEALLADGAVDAVLVCTRHDLHASMALAALRAGKHVLVEKPLALTPAEVESLERFYARARGEAPVLLTGFNRRFSPHARALREWLAGRSGPAMLDYRMNAGHIPLDHWVHGAEGGGRNIGEACHIYDLLGYVVGAPVETVQALSISPPAGHGALARNDNFVATLRFADGSVATLTYTALGSTRYPKERLEVFCDGAVATLDDYRELRYHGASGRPRGVRTRRQDKGHLAELEAFGECVARGGAWPIPLAEQLQATRISFEVERALTSGTGEA